MGVGFIMALVVSSGLNSGDIDALDDDDQLPLLEQAKKLKGKNVPHPSE